MSINVPLSEWLPYPRAVVQELNALFPECGWGTYPGHDPNQNRAADGMIPGYKTAAGIAKGTELAEWIWANRVRYNLWYVIWRGRIISQTRPAAGWARYFAANDPSDSKAHRNHVHLSVYKPVEWTSVWLDRLTPGVTNSESVAFVQRALKIPETGDYDDATVSAVRVFQRAIGDAPEYADGNLGKWQAAELLKRSGQRAILRPEPSGATAPGTPSVASRYVVKPGDTLSGIASALGVEGGWPELAKLNPGIDPDRLSVGLVLDVPVAEPPPIVVTDPKPPEPPKPEPEYPLPDSGEVYLDKLTPGVTDSDSVAYVQAWLEKVLSVDLVRTGDYDDDTAGAVKAYQRDKLGDAPEYADGDLGQLQTIALAKAADAEVTIYADSKTGGQVWPEVKPPPHVDPPPATPEDHVVTVATWNVHVSNSLANMKAGLAEIAEAGADAVGLQELSDDAKMKGLKAYAKSIGWASTNRNSAVTSMWNTKTTELVREGYTLVQKSGEPWEDGAGGDDTIYKIIMEVVLRDKASGKEWVLLNHHLVPTVESGGRFRKDKPKRVAVFKRQIAALRKALAEYGKGGRMVAVTGDWNVAWGGEAADWVEAQLDASGATVNWDEAPDQDTHTGSGVRAIDWVAARNGYPGRTRRLSRHNSDHYPVVVDITLKG